MTSGKSSRDPWNPVYKIMENLNEISKTLKTNVYMCVICVCAIISAQIFLTVIYTHTKEKYLERNRVFCSLKNKFSTNFRVP
jgi:Na+/melibiose symporter-like transporter